MHISFPLQTEAFRAIAAEPRVVLPASRTAIETAYWRGDFAGAYYFLDVEESVVRDMRDWFLETAAMPGVHARACRRAAEAIQAHLAMAWCAVPCPRCGGAIARSAGTRARDRLVECTRCHWAIPT